MSIVLAHDAIHANVAHLPAGQAAGYTTGSSDIRWTAQDWAHHPAAVRIDQDATASDLTADVLDVERGAATNGEAAHWYTMALRSFTAGTRPGQRHPAIYTSASQRDAARQRAQSRRRPLRPGAVGGELEPDRPAGRRRGRRRVRAVPRHRRPVRQRAVLRHATCSPPRG